MIDKGSGWVKMWRSLDADPSLQEIDIFGLYTKFQLRAARAPVSVNFRSRIIRLERGQLCLSVREFADKHGLSHKRMRTALKRLTEGHRITVDGGTHYSIVTVCDYDLFQGVLAEQGTLFGNMGHAAGHTRGTQNNKLKKTQQEEHRSKLDEEQVERWRQACIVVKDDIGTKAYRSWVEPVSLVEVNGQSITIGAPTKFIRDWFSDNYADAMAKAWGGGTEVNVIIGGR